MGDSVSKHSLQGVKSTAAENQSKARGDSFFQRGKNATAATTPRCSLACFSEIADCNERGYRCGYFTRLSTSSTTPPPDPAGLLHFISSPMTVIVRGCVAPNQFGNVLCSIFNVKILSATE
jgi:hypothetical protein